MRCFFNNNNKKKPKKKQLMFFLFLHKNICCWYSLEAPRWGTSNEYPQHMFFLWRNQKNIFLIPCLIWSYDKPLWQNSYANSADPPGRGLTWNIKPCFYRIKKKTKTLLECCVCNFEFQFFFIKTYFVGLIREKKKKTLLECCLCNFEFCNFNFFLENIFYGYH